MPPRLPMPLTRLPSLFPGQVGVPGTDEDTGLRLHPTGRVFYVDPNYPGASDARDGTNPTAPMLTVAAALGQCRDWLGDTVMVSTNSMWLYSEGGQGLATATYTTPIREEVTCAVNGVRIVGAGRGPTGVMWNPTSNAGTCITVTGTDVTIEGFSFDDGPYANCNGIHAEWNGTTLLADNLTVRYCYFTDANAIAIQLEYAWNCSIHDNIFMECPYGIYDDPAVVNGVAYSKINDNWFQNCMTGALALRNANDNEIFRNRVFNRDAIAAAACTDEGFDFTNGARNKVSENHFSCLLPVGVGDINDLCTGSGTDSWTGNYCTNGLIVVEPT